MALSTMQLLPIDESAMMWLFRGRCVEAGLSVCIWSVLVLRAPQALVQTRIKFKKDHTSYSVRDV